MLAYLAGSLVLILWTIAGRRLESPAIVLGAHLACFLAVVLLLIAASRFEGLPWQYAHAWYPLAVIPFLFRELHFLVPAVNPTDVDDLLIRADLVLCGVHPTLAIEAWIWPPAVEVLQVVYALFYFIPVALGIVLWRRKMWSAFAESQWAIVLGFLSSYLGYLMVPALGPRFSQCPPPSGLWAAAWIQNTINDLELEMRDCFPSGHVEVSLLTLWCAYRFHRPTAWVLTPVVTALVLSTVYLRYHYVVDVLAGVVWAVAVAWTVKGWRRMPNSE